MTAPSNVGTRLSPPVSFGTVDWSLVPDLPGVYVIYDREEAIYVGMAGRDGEGSLRRRLKDHGSGQIVNMFAQYLFLARVQFVSEERIRHPREAKAAVQSYIRSRCRLSWIVTPNAAEARSLEIRLKRELSPALNP